MSTDPRRTREIILYVPAGSRSTARIPRGSAIVGEPRFGAREVEIYFESAAPERRGLRTLADRALSASGRMLERAVFGGCLLVPPKALTIVGTFNFAEGSIALTGPHSERAVADWLGTPQLDQGELRESGSIFAGHELMSTGPTSATHLEPALVYALLERGGIEPDGEGWRAPDGRRTVTVGDALIWALERIARGDEHR
jgi:hypothetical protein